MNLSVLITCHNRREKTLRCLESLFAQKDIDALTVQVWLVDDGSADGTAEAVASRFRGVEIIRGNGELFWCAGMRLAWSIAAQAGPDAFLWLNDDVVLELDALARLRAVAITHANAIVVGSCACPETRTRTYGGLRRLGRHPGKVAAIQPGPDPARCDTFEGNIVWVPASVVARLGVLGSYRHAMGDLDYGYRAAQARIPAIVAPGFLGTCASNSTKGTWEDQELPFLARWKKLRGVKGLPAQDWWQFCRSHGGLRAPLYFIGPFLRVVLYRWAPNARQLFSKATNNS